MNVVPPSLSNSMLPPWASMIRLKTANSSPVPLALPVVSSEKSLSLMKWLEDVV